MIYGLSAFIYVVASSLTRPMFLGDTMYYLRTAHPGAPEFWDFGHLFWRPLLYLLLRHLSALDIAGRFLRAFHILDFASTIAGLLAVCFTVATVRLFTRGIVATTICAVLLSFSQVVLTYSKGGCAYIFGFLALSAAFYISLGSSIREQRGWRVPIVSGALLALSVCLWLPYVLAIPGVLLAPIVFSGNPKRRWRLAVATAIVCAAAGAASYGAVTIHLGIRNLHGFVTWAQASSHSVTISGARRAVFGFARSFLSLGEDGVIFKRYLLHDPYNPVGFREILATALWKVILFYFFVASILVNLARSPLGRKASTVLLVSAVPVLAFAVSWQGTDLERYLPLFPALMLAIGLGVGDAKLSTATTWLAAVFVASMLISNVSAFSSGARARQLREMSRTLQSLNEKLPSDSLVLLPPMHPLQRIYWDFPEALPLDDHGLKLERIVDLGEADTPRWRSLACADMRQRWSRQAAVVIASSLLEDLPPRDSSWVEGDDPRVHWHDLNDFISQLQMGTQVTETEFRLIPPTENNLAVIRSCR